MLEYSLGLKQRDDDSDGWYRDFISWPMINGELFAISGLSPSEPFDEEVVFANHYKKRAIGIFRDAFIFYGDQ